MPGTNEIDTPSAGNAKWDVEYIGGLEGNAEWRLNGGPYSVVLRTGFELIHETSLDRTVVQPAIAGLLSNDLWGVAIGPSFYSNILTANTNGLGNSPSSSFIGGEIEAQPFRVTSIPFLHDITLALSAYHSLGQVAYIDTANGKASAMVVNADIGWHVHY